MKTPTLRQRFSYDIGRALPEDLHEWVLHDLTGHGATERYLFRFTWPIIPFFALVLLFPGPMILKLGMVVMMIVPLIIFTVALSYVWRRYRLGQHGLDPGLIDRNKTTELEKERYRMTYRHP